MVLRLCWLVVFAGGTAVGVCGVVFAVRHRYYDTLLWAVLALALLVALAWALARASAVPR